MARTCQTCPRRAKPSVGRSNLAQIEFPRFPTASRVFRQRNVQRMRTPRTLSELLYLNSLLTRRRAADLGLRRALVHGVFVARPEKAKKHICLENRNKYETHTHTKQRSSMIPCISISNRAFPPGRGAGVGHKLSALLI